MVSIFNQEYYRRIITPLLLFSLLTLSGVSEGAVGGTIKVALLSGDVSVRNPGADSYKAVTVGDKVKFGDLISTSVDSKVQLVFADGSFLNISESSLVRVDNYIWERKSFKRKVFIRIFKGAGRFIFRSMAGEGSLLRIDTDEAVINTRVADIIVSVGEFGTMVLSVEGRAVVGNKSKLIVGTVNLNSNEETILTRDGAPSAPKLVFRSEMRDWLRKTDMLR